MSCSIYTTSSLSLVHVTKSKSFNIYWAARGLDLKLHIFHDYNQFSLTFLFNNVSLENSPSSSPWSPIYSRNVSPKHSMDSCPGSYPGVPSSLEVFSHPLVVTWRLLRWLQHSLSSWLLDQNPLSQCIILRSPIWAEFIPVFPPKTVLWPTQ